MATDGTVAITANITSASADLTVGDDLGLASDAAVLSLGADADVTITHDADDGIELKSAATADDNPFLLTLQTGETDIAASDVLGTLNFQAPDESSGTDAILIAAGIEAVSEGTFSSSSNATKLSFKTASSAAATENMSLSSSGNLTVSGDVTISGNDLIFANNESISNASNGNVAIKVDGTAQVNFASALIAPESDGALDLGSSSREFKDLWVDGVAYADAIGFGTTALTLPTGAGSNGQVLQTNGSNALAWSSQTATDVTISDNENTNESNALIFTSGGDVDGGSIGLESDGDATYNPSTGTIAATNFSGNLTGTLQTPAQGNVTSLGTLTTLTVDNVITDGVTIGHSADPDLMTLANGSVTFTGSTVIATADVNGGAIDGAAIGASSASTGAFTTITSSGIIKTDDATEATSATDGSLQTDGGLSVVKDAVIGDDLKLLSDAAVLNFGADSDVTLTHVHNTGVLLNSTSQLQFRDAALMINSSANGQLDIDADVEVEITTATVDLNGALDVSGTSTLAGAVASGAITSSGIIKTDDATEATSTTDGSLQTDGGLSVVKDAVIGDDLALLSDGAVLNLGAGKDVTITHDPDDGIELKSKATTDNNPVLLTMLTGEINIEAGDVLGTINFQAPDEETGTDAIKVAAGIEAVSEGDFSSISNATKLSFKTAASDAATETMSLSSAGKLTVSGDLTISGDDLYMNTNTDGYMLIADGTNFNPTAVSGDISITNAGVTAIASAVIVNADINASAAIADSKLATITTADKVSAAAIQIDGATDGTGISLANADKFLVDDGGTTKYITASQLNTYTSTSIAADDVSAGNAAVTISTSSGDITLDSPADVILDADGADVIIKDDGTAIGTFTNSSSDFVVMANVQDKDIIFKGNDGGSTITALTMDMSEAGAASFNGVVTLSATTVSTSASSGALVVGGGAGVAADLYVGDDLKLLSDAAVLSLGADSDVTLTHVADTGVLLNSTSQLQFRDAALTINSSTNGQLDIDADVEVEITTATVDLNGALDVSGTSTLAGAVASGAITSSGIIKTDDATEATSTTDGSLQTDGGLSVVKDAVIGDDLKLLSDAAVLSLGADSDVTLTHVA